MGKYDDFDAPKKSGMSVPLPLAMGAMAVVTLVGLILGYVINGLIDSGEQEAAAEVASQIDDLAMEEQAQALEDERFRVVRLQDRVQSLEEQLDSKEAELAAFKKKKVKSDKDRAVAKKRRNQLEEEIAAMRIELAAVTAERDELRTELKTTLKKLDHQIRETDKFRKKARKYKKESTTNLWSAFGSSAKVKICDRGTRKRHEKCHQAVEGALSSRIQSKFKICVDTYQAVPVLRQAKKGGGLPKFSEWLPNDNKFTKKGWYIVFCDPTLPEAEDADLTRGPDEYVPPSAPMDTTPDLGELDDFEMPDIPVPGSGSSTASQPTASDTLAGDDWNLDLDLDDGDTTTTTTGQGGANSALDDLDFGDLEDFDLDPEE